MNDITNSISNIEMHADEELANIKSEEDLKVVKAGFVGKSGSVTGLLKLLAGLPAEERPGAGRKINDLKNLILQKISEAEARLKSKSIERSLKSSADITLPGRMLSCPGRLHPVSLVLRRVEGIFLDMGFSVYEGTEVETDYYNFEALNVPKDHPARDMQDTFYIKHQIPNPKSQTNPKSQIINSKHELLLRTHTSPVQIHVMEKFKPPIRMIFPGAVYRKDADITHSPMFHQVEGLMVGENVRMSDLKGILTVFVHKMFGEGAGVRFRPSFFPFTEPSAEIDIECMMCRGSKTAGGEPCRVCKGTGWLEILGCGMVDPNVFKAVGYDPEKVSGFAFGLGVERVAMLKYGISDIRLFFENDVRFLRQF